MGISKFLHSVDNVNDSQNSDCAEENANNDQMCIRGWKKSDNPHTHTQCHSNNNSNNKFIVKP